MTSLCVLIEGLNNCDYVIIISGGMEPGLHFACQEGIPGPWDLLGV